MSDIQSPPLGGSQVANQFGEQGTSSGEAQPLRALASPVHTLGLLGFLGAFAYLSYTQAGQMRAMAAPNHFQMYLPTMAIEWLMFGYIVYGSRCSGVSLKELLGPRWSSGKQTLVDIGIAAGFWLGSLFVLAIVGHLMGMKSDFNNVKFMMPNTAIEMVLWVVLSITAGICEETIFRAYLQRQFAAWTHSLPVGVVLSAAIFGAGHIYQNGKQAILIGVYGVLFGVLAALRRSTKPGMMAHAWQDSAAGIVSSILAKRHLFGA
jgi:membrane protease YdiL (CAAX protease family)